MPKINHSKVKRKLLSFVSLQYCTKVNHARYIIQKSDFVESKKPIESKVSSTIKGWAFFIGIEHSNRRQKTTL